MSILFINCVLWQNVKTITLVWDYTHVYQLKFRFFGKVSRPEREKKTKQACTPTESVVFNFLTSCLTVRLNSKTKVLNARSQET
jgi:hypothetical protein